LNQPTRFLSAFRKISLFKDHLSGLVVRVLGYRSRDPGSIHGTTRKKSSGSGTGFTQPTTEELLDRKVAAPVWKTENTAVGIRQADHVAPYIHNMLSITSPMSGGLSVGIVRSRTQTMEFSFFLVWSKLYTIGTNSFWLCFFKEQFHYL
jgi:hypothetical protein